MPVLAPHPDYFGQAVASILVQTFTDWELIIVEDPSDRRARDTLKTMADPRIRHIENPSRTSLVRQRNQGLAAACGTLIAMLDADDVAEPDRLARQVAFLDAHPDVTVVGSQLTIIDTGGNVLGYRAYPQSHDEIMTAMCRYSPIGQPSVMFRRDRVLAAGGYQYEDYPVAEDYDLWCRLAKAGHRFANLPEPLIRYRIHPGATKTSKLRSLLRATIALKHRHWCAQMNLRARGRLLLERVLVWMPGWLVLKLFMATQYRKTPPPRTLT